MTSPHLRAPDEDGAILASPPLREAEALLENNRRLARPALSDDTGPDMHLAARREVLEASGRYHLELRESVLPADADRPIIMAGHQPELFHPGVWLKSFALSGLAAATGTTPVNFLVDSDVPRSSSLHVPALGRDPGGAIQTVPFDRHMADVPFEELQICDPAEFHEFPGRVAPIMGSWPFQPIFFEFWNDVVDAGRSTPRLGDRLALARRRWEWAWDCRNREVAQSDVCRTPAFGQFFIHILANLPRFASIHNSALADYRKRNRVRGVGRPVADLVIEADWLEMPFWIWHTDRPRRQRLFARLLRHGAELRIGREGPVAATVSTRRPMGRSPIVELENQGLKIRTRALLTTMYARLFLCDLFIHGLGGAKYDEMTDDIIRRFWDIAPPRFLVLSGTLRLPFGRERADIARCRRLERELRDFRWNPERHVTNGKRTDRARQLSAEKSAWIHRPAPTHAARSQRFVELRRLNDELRGFIKDKEPGIERQVEDCKRQLRVDDLLHGREFAFCLFPEAKLRSFCRQVLRPS